MVDRTSADALLRAQKWTQVVLAVLLTGFFILLLPGVGLFALPVGCLYIVWSVRASSRNNWSLWLAFLLSLALAILGSTVVSLDIVDWFSGRPGSLAEFAIEITLSLLAVLVVALHLINWRRLPAEG